MFSAGEPEAAFAQKVIWYIPFICTNMSTLAEVSKYQVAAAYDPFTAAFIFSDCVPHVAHRSAVSDSNWPPPPTLPQNPPVLLSHHDSGVGNVDLLIIIMSPTLNAAEQGEDTVTAGATQFVTPETG